MQRKFALPAFVGLALILAAALPACAQEQEFNTVLFQSTFKIEGPAGPRSVTFGTAFLMSKPIPNSNKFQPVLITAKHVLDGIVGDTATLNLRRQTDSGWQRIRYTFKIRDAGQPLWASPDDIDVAVMYIKIPDQIQNQIPRISTALLADDEMLSLFEVNPGDELTALGYPLGAESNSAGFAILRSGKIASYPLLPTEATQKFLFDFAIFPGNSGGPVYLSSNNRTYGGRMHTNETVHFIVGLVTQQLSGNVSNNKESLSLAAVIHASWIKKAVEMLPEPIATETAK
jgi:S1-C subfamily serine protease